ncbi:MAG: cyclopropane-fatty-acyl-phospholipid synthase [Parasphingorhabdus sp.]|jgi:cyclopropane-fatty-acyl-phospholipid synthase
MVEKKKIQEIENILQSADVRLDGARPWDIKLHDERALASALGRGTLGIGESYMDRWWDCDQLDVMIDKVHRSDYRNSLDSKFNLLSEYIKSRLLNLQSTQRAFQVGEHHYDLGNDLYEAMLDPRMVYTCGYWHQADNLDAAQTNKLDLVCRKINLQPKQRVLDIGCGWGSFAEFAAREYGAEIIGVTVSKEQAELARRRCEGLPVEIRLQDYREVNEKFDHIVSLGMFEHVGNKNYQTYFNKAHDCLKEEGIFLLHTIGHMFSVKNGDPWINRYIFPNSMIPSITHIGRAIEKLFVMEDWHNFGADYDRTLMAWNENFEECWPGLREKYGDRFYRMWRYYLLVCAGTFRSRYVQLWQIVLSKNGVSQGYATVR